MLRIENLAKINNGTQRANHIISAYDNAWATQLYQVYPTHYSGAKASAYNDCVELMKQLGGHDLKITGACGNFFSVGFIFVKDNKKCLAYITHANNYYIELEDAIPSDSMNDDEWFNDFENRYNKLSDTTKKHLANACPHITSREQADGIMKMSEVFDILFRLENNEGTN